MKTTQHCIMLPWTAKMKPMSKRHLSRKWAWVSSAPSICSSVTLTYLEGGGPAHGAGLFPEYAEQHPATSNTGTRVRKAIPLLSRTNQRLTPCSSQHPRLSLSLSIALPLLPSPRWYRLAELTRSTARVLLFPSSGILRHSLKIPGGNTQAPRCSFPFQLLYPTLLPCLLL